MEKQETTTRSLGMGNAHDVDRSETVILRNVVEDGLEAMLVAHVHINDFVVANVFDHGYGRVNVAIVQCISKSKRSIGARTSDGVDRGHLIYLSIKPRVLSYYFLEYLYTTMTLGVPINSSVHANVSCAALE
jgi:hypothetical protein